MTMFIKQLGLLISFYSIPTTKAVNSSVRALYISHKAIPSPASPDFNLTYIRSKRKK